MATKKEASTGLLKLLEDQVADIYYAEKQILKTLPKMAKATTNDELRTAFTDHAEETKAQIARLEEVFAALDLPVKGKKCPAIDGILEEGSEIMDEFSDDAALDAGLVAAAQKVEHYEIASYGSMCAWAEQLGLEDVVSLITETLEEEKGADEKLSNIAEEVVNIEADEEGEEEEELVDMDESSSPTAKSRNSATKSSPKSSSNGTTAKSGRSGTKR